MIKNKLKLKILTVVDSATNVYFPLIIFLPVYSLIYLHRYLNNSLKGSE